MNWNMKDGEMVMISPPLLESRTDAYLEWLANELIMMANKTRS
jgi:23S rRNA A2030 N6-methylase RlmJ